MPTIMDDKRHTDADELGALAAKGKQGVVGEMVAMLKENKKWWLTPIIVMLLLVAFLVVLGGTGAAPFIYSVF